MIVPISKWGNSQAVRLSQNMLRQAKISVNDNLEIIIEDRKIILKATDELPTLKELLEDWDGAPPEPFDWGEPVGRELL